MTNRHISCNIRFILDLIDYSEYIDVDNLIFLDFYRAFDSVEHQFLFRSLQSFGFGEMFVSYIRRLYKDISSCVMLYPNTTKSFSVCRSVRQGCPCSPFLFLIVVELLSIQIRQSNVFQGLKIFEREIWITQLADDTVLFLENKQQIETALEIIDTFSNASGLKLNLTQCELLCLYNTEETLLGKIPVKESVKYLGIHISKNLNERQVKN